MKLIFLMTAVLLNAAAVVQAQTQADYKTCYQTVSIEKAINVIDQMEDVCRRIPTFYPRLGGEACVTGAKFVFENVINKETDPLVSAVKSCREPEIGFHNDCISGATTYVRLLCQ